jgi:hypothetical protein
VVFVDDESPVDQLAVQCSDHPFADRVRPWRSRWTGQDLDAVSGEDRIEGPGEPTVPISKQELDRDGPVTEV